MLAGRIKYCVTCGHKLFIEKGNEHKECSKMRESTILAPKKKEDSTRWNVVVLPQTKSTIHICDCGNRYLKTRDRQKECLRCIAYSVV